MNRTKGILAAGTFTGLVLITILALGFGRIGQSEASSTTDTAATFAVESPLQTTEEESNEETLQAWQEYSAQLEKTVRTLQERDAAYQLQLETANQTILQLQDQINSSPAPSFAAEREKYEEYKEHDEDEEHEEHEEHESEEHEAFEFGEEDDD